MKKSREPLFCLSLFETTEICLGCTKMKISTGKKAFPIYYGGNFLTSPTFDCTPGNPPAQIGQKKKKKKISSLIFPKFGGSPFSKPLFFSPSGRTLI